MRAVWGIGGVILLLLSGLAMGDSVNTAGVVSPQHIPEKYLFRVQLNTTEELDTALKRAAALFEEKGFTPVEPIAFVLHGSQAKIFLRENYQHYKATVDLAARLSAFKVVDIKICQQWLTSNDVLTGQLPPFVDTVPLAPDEARRLVDKEGYSYF